MDREQVMKIAFQLIAESGDALDHFNSAIDCAEKGEFEKAKKEIALGNVALANAHKIQTNLLVAEANSVESELSFIMIHAQDHLMTTLNFERLAKRFISLYERLKEK